MDDKEGHGDSIFAPQIIYRFLKRQTIVIQYLYPLKAFKLVSSKAHGFSLVCTLVCIASPWIYVTYIRILPTKAFNHIPQGKKK